jgi:hypothetical protein
VGLSIGSIKNKYGCLETKKQRAEKAHPVTVGSYSYMMLCSS